MMNKNLHRGFTLMELMIGVAILAILTAITYPSYTNSVNKGRRGDATAALLRLQLDQERYRANNLSFAASLANLGWATTNSDKGYYTVAISNANATSFTATATARGAQANDSACRILTVNENGPVAPTNAEKECWRIALN